MIVIQEDEFRGQLTRELRDGAAHIPSGKFIMGSNVSENESPKHEVYTDDFLLSKFLVTKAQFVSFLNAIKFENEVDGVYLYLNIFNPASKIKREHGIYIVEDGFENHPITCVNWSGSNAFASWIGGRLPTEAEWETASKGRADNIFPWGHKNPDSSLANYGEIVGSTTPVGKYAPNDYDLYDMAGNAFEWCKIGTEQITIKFQV